MSLWAIADIHISYKSNREAIQNLKPRPEDGLILAGDSKLAACQTASWRLPNRCT